MNDAPMRLPKVRPAEPTGLNAAAAKLGTDLRNHLVFYALDTEDDRWAADSNLRDPFLMSWDDRVLKVLAGLIGVQVSDWHTILVGRIAARLVADEVARRAGELPKDQMVPPITNLTTSPEEGGWGPRVVAVSQDQTRELLEHDEPRPTSPGAELRGHFAAICPDADERARWTLACQGDDYAAMLCATSALAVAASESVLAAVRRGDAQEAGLIAQAIEVRNGAQADVAQYYGDALAAQHPDVIRAAGFRVGGA